MDTSMNVVVYLQDGGADEFAASFYPEFLVGAERRILDARQRGNPVVRVETIQGNMGPPSTYTADDVLELVRQAREMFSPPPAPAGAEADARRQRAAQRLLGVRRDAIVSQADQDSLGISRSDNETVETALGRAVAWSARCDCYEGGAGHSNNSGRCGARDVFDPRRKPGQAAICPSCRGHCEGKR